ncbi:MAG: hypothetical protein ACFE9N_12885, partial [Promethearchaeota archaeon]
MNEKEILIKELVNSGINITPSILDFLLNLDEPLKSVRLIIKSISFLPNFNGHLTEEILHKISKEEMHKGLRKVLLKKTESISFKENVKNEDNKKQISNLVKPIKSENSRSEIFEISEETRQLKNLSQDKITIQKYYQDSGKMVMKHKLKGAPFERSKSTLGFKHIAKDYESNFEILQDHTCKLYT